MNEAADLVLEMKNVTQKFPGTLAVDNVTFHLLRGEVHAIVGENGAGKSTLMKMLAGLFNNYTGEIYLNGKLCTLHTPALSKEHSIGMVFQELSLARNISIWENVLVGKLPKKMGFVDKNAAIKQTKSILARVGLENLDPTLEISDISQCDAQLVEIAKVLANNPSVLVMDEPTSALSTEEVNRLFAIIESLKKEKVSIIYISHHLQEIFRISDHITVMRDGRNVGTYETKDTNPDQIIELMVGKSVREFYSEIHTKIEDREVLSVEDFTRWGFFHHLNFNLKKGEILAIFGLAGSGRTEIAQSIIGINEPDQGKIFVDGKEVRISSVSDALNNGIAYLSEDRKHYGLALTQSVTDNVLTSIIDRLASTGIYYAKKHDQIVKKKIDELSISPKQPERLVNSLSGGNQQKVLLAKWLTTDANILILDEPTRGVDIGAKKIIHDAIQEFAAQGNAVILLSSDLPEVVGLSTRALILQEGRITGELNQLEIEEKSLLSAANG